MRTWTNVAIAAVLGGILAPSSSALAGDGVTWMRDMVRQRELVTLQNALGPRATEIPKTSRIIGGNVAAANAWPFQVGLLDSGVSNNFNAQFCGGSLIDSQHVLTAAHCVSGLRAAELDILVGTQSLASGGTRHRASSIRIHPRYRAATSDYDVAVVTLGSATSGITPVQMLSAAQENALSAPGTNAYVTGWGDTKKGSGTSYPTALNEVQVPIVSRTVCNRFASYGGDVSLRMICAGFQQGGKDACQGDSGGPLIVRDSGGNWTVQAGIVSWGIGCALRNLYGVYSRVAILSSWVSSVIDSRNAVVSAGSCESRGAGQVICLEQAIASAAAESQAYLDRIRRNGTSAQGRAVEAAQRAWSRSLTDLCAFDTTTGGELSRKACVLRETRNRAATLSEHLLDIGK